MEGRMMVDGFEFAHEDGNQDGIMIGLGKRRDEKTIEGC